MRRIRTVTVDLLAALTLFCVYCGCVLFCLMTGASVYREANAATETRFRLIYFAMLMPKCL